MTDQELIDEEDKAQPESPETTTEAEKITEVEEKTLETEDTTESEPDDEASKVKLAEQLKQAEAKIAEQLDVALRAKAELENVTRRHSEELEKAHKFALKGFVQEMLQVWDSLELGVDAAANNDADVASIREGSELTLKLLADVMAKFGVEQIHPLDQLFNPDEHQAMQMVARDDVDPNTVIEVIQKGYKLNGRLVRPALVILSKG